MKKPHSDDVNPDTKAQKRAEKRRKEKEGPIGGGWTAQAQRAQVNKGYAGLPKALKPKVNIRMPREGK
jgi:hypothetical protein